MIERVDMTGQEMIYIKFEDSDEFIQVNTMDSAWKEIADHAIRRRVTELKAIDKATD